MWTFVARATVDTSVDAYRALCNATIVRRPAKWKLIQSYNLSAIVRSVITRFKFLYNTATPPIHEHCEICEIILFHVYGFVLIDRRWYPRQLVCVALVLLTITFFLNDLLCNRCCNKDSVVRALIDIHEDALYMYNLSDYIEKHTAMRHFRRCSTRRDGQSIAKALTQSGASTSE